MGDKKKGKKGREDSNDDVDIIASLSKQNEAVDSDEEVEEVPCSHDFEKMAKPIPILLRHALSPTLLTVAPLQQVPSPLHFHLWEACPSTTQPCLLVWP